MIAAIARALGWLAGKPQVFVPAIIVAAIDLLLLLFLGDALFGVLADLVIGQGMVNAPLLQLPFLLYQKYFSEINLLLAGGFVSVAAQAWLLFVYARYASGMEKGETIGSAMAYSLKRIWGIIGLIVFVFLVGFLIMLALQLVFWVAGIEQITGFILMLIVMILSIYAFVRLSFAPVAMAAEDCKLKEGLKKSWNFSTRLFWGILVFYIVVLIIGSIISLIGDNIAAMFENEIIVLAVIFVFSLIVSAFSSLAPALYYLEKK